jgi:hypothetical protein
MSNDATIGGWSIDKYNIAGQKMCIDDENNIFVIYDYTKDMREYKDNLCMNKNVHKIMIWYSKILQSSIENKFNQKGFFKCIKNKNTYSKICFGKPISFTFWIEAFKQGVIYHDGYSKINGRSRHTFRASNNFWNELIIEEY